ncbi:hypothetical protein SHKM778_14450 [Streptomyces sp. KM77-8]|uniref:DivIVA domain-containing protein n=1 Tax=Streptomyces haneummycinicus TaxID=3074435 RepID=A0AAT9HCX5_9ACTN
MVMFLFLVVALAVVVTAVTLAVVSGGDNGPLPEAAPERLRDSLPPDRPVSRADVDGLRFPLAARGYRMAEVDDALGETGRGTVRARRADRRPRIRAGRGACRGGAPLLDKPAAHPEDGPL